MAPEQVPQAQHDLEQLIRYGEILEFSQWSHQEMRHQDDAEQVNTGLDFARIAVRGNTERFIGMVIQRDRPGSEENNVRIICIYRDPDWAGFNSQLSPTAGAWRSTSSTTPITPGSPSLSPQSPGRRRRRSAKGQNPPGHSARSPGRPPPGTAPPGAAGTA